MTKVLLDTCIWGGAVATLEAAGHDVRWVGDFDRDPGDESILALAALEARVLVTLDKDFGELAIVRRRPHAGIVRLVDARATQHGPLAVRVLAHYGDELLAGAIVTAELGRVRVRPPDGSQEREAQ